MAKILEDQVWAGSEASLQTYLTAQDIQPEQLKAWRDEDEDEDDESPRLLTVEDGIAVVSIKGPLVNSAAWYNEFLGLTGYPEIREAMVAAAEDPSVKHILLDIDSGGGSVSGVSDTGKLIRMINDQVKPVTAFTDGAMFSAAYWLGASAGAVFASEGAGVGSIGVIATHMERSKQYKEAGIGVTVVRAGKYKALANSVEPLSEEGKAQIQAAVDSAYKLFLNHVSGARGKSVEFTDSVMAQGREFYGQAAADASLIDSVRSYDEVVKNIKQNFVDGRINTAYTSGKQATGLRVESTGDVAMAKKTLTEQDVAALASGVTVGAVVASPVETDAVTLASGDQVEQVAQTEQTQEPEAVSGTVELTAEVDTSAGTIRLLSDQLKAAQDDLLSARLELARTQDKLGEVSAVTTPLAEIAAKAVNNMRVALGGSALDMQGFSAAQILADHAALQANFARKYPVGGVAAVSQDVGGKSTEHKVDALTQARLNAVRYSK